MARFAEKVTALRNSRFLVMTVAVLAAIFAIVAVPTAFAHTPHEGDSPRVFSFEVAARAMSQDAVDAGGVVEYSEAWYVSHNHDLGAVFREFEAGSRVLIDGRDVTIEGGRYFNYNFATIGDVREALGYDVVLFQTCMDREDGGIVVYYGHDANGSGPYGLGLDE